MLSLTLSTLALGSAEYRAYLQTKVGHPASIDAAFDCAWREYAFAYAPQIQPWLVHDKTRMEELHEALQLAPLCGKAFTAPRPPSIPPSDTGASSADISFFVDAVKGNDNQPFSPTSGGMTKPFRTIGTAIEATRAVRGTAPRLTAAVMLRGGVHYLSETIELSAGDSNLEIAAYANETAVVSGGVHLAGLRWKRWNATGSIQRKTDATVYVADLSNVDLPAGVPALQYGDPTARSRATLARYPNADPERDLFPKGYVTADTEWKPPTYAGGVCNPKIQCGPSTTVTHAVPTSEWHGMYQNWTTGVGGACDAYDPPRSPWCSADFYLERQFPEMHTRHPSGFAGEVHLPNFPYSAPSGGVVHAWRPGHWYTWMFEVDAHVPPKTNRTIPWTVYTAQNNVFGKVATPRVDTDAVKYLGDFESADDCFKACNSSVKGPCSDWTWHHTDFPSPDYAKGCYFTVGGEWSPTQEHLVTSARGPHKESGYFTFGAGGNQGGEGSETAGEWFIEGIQEELDAPNEFWFDPVPRQLYLIPNATGGSGQHRGAVTPPSDVVVPTLINLFKVSGSQAMPVVNVSFRGITLTANRPSFMEPRSNPSGGDWALERMGAILFEGTQNVSVAGCTFEKLDSNAIFLSGYNQGAAIVRNHFRWLGQSAIASWGRPLDNDATNGDFPRWTLIEGNFVHEIGHIQKQSSFYFQAETAQTTLRNNICFNIPRAAINFNDGMGGGSVIEHNLLFNTCRESSDHGAFNSWDRLPYWTTVRDGKTPSTIPAWNDVHHNFIVANYAADGGCLDNDDGSSYYRIHENFCVFGGHKSDFDGNMKYSFGNIHAYANVYGANCLQIGAQLLPPKGYAEQYYGNRCVLADAGDTYLNVGDILGGHCLDGSAASRRVFEEGLAVRNNTVYVPGGSPKVLCGGTMKTFKEFQAMGYDPTSTAVGQMPSAAEIIAWAKEILA